MTFLHCADLHLDSKLLGLERYEGAPAEALRRASRRALEGLVETAIQEKVRLVLIAGDVFDGDWKDYNTGLFFSRQMGRLQEAGIRVAIIAGNHDAESQISKQLAYPENVRVLSTDKPGTILFEDLGIAVHGQGFRTREVLEDLSQTYPDKLPGLINIGMLHTSANGRTDHQPYAPCIPQELARRGYDYWALGHVHRRELLLHRDEYGCWALFPGNLQGRHIREVGPKGFSLIRIEDGEVQAPVHRTCDAARWANCEVDATGAQDDEEVLGRIQRALEVAQRSAEGRLLAVRVTLTGRSRARARIEARREAFIGEIRNLGNLLGGEGVWVEKVRIDLRHEYDTAELRRKDEPIGDLLRMLDDPSEPMLKAWNEDLQAFIKLLPPDVLESFGEVSPSDLVRRLTRDAEELLVSKVLD